MSRFLKFIYAVIRLCRPHQWYKNLLIFLPIVFSKNLMTTELWPSLVLGFISLILISSVNYIFNDTSDYQKDKKNPEKMRRPIASGIVSRWQASIIAVLLLFGALYISFSLNIIFFYIVIMLFFLTSVYSVYLKNELFADIIIIGINFVLRTISGSILMNAEISPWVIICVFFFTLFLTVGKRYSEIIFLKEDASNNRKVLNEYDSKTLNSLMDISTTVFIITFSIFTFFSQHSQNLIYLVPLFVYVILRYTWLIRNGSIIARHPEKIYKDKRLFVSLLFFTFLSILLIYLP